MSSSSSILDNVKDYYGKVLKSSGDLKTQVCEISSSDVDNNYICAAISEVHPTVSAKYYGCGLSIPPGVEGATILDLGSGSGRDCFAVSKLAGPDGRVVGIDMTSEQIDVANTFVEYHTEKFGYKEPNVRFIQGFVEDLQAAGLQKDYFDIIISNCVVNLCPDKEAVLSEAFNVLKPGGEFYFADMYTDTYQSDSVKQDKTLWGEGFGGALHWKQFHDISRRVGFTSPCLISCTPIEYDSEYLKERLGDAKYCSATYRLFKPFDAQLQEETLSSPGGTALVTYNGEILHHEKSFLLDHLLTFQKGVQVSIPLQKANILQNSRFIEYFEFLPVKISDQSEPLVNRDVPENPFDVIRSKGGQLKPCKKQKPCQKGA